MRVGVLGAGNIGGTLGTIWAGKGHEVTFGVRDPQRPDVRDLLAAAGPRARAASIAEAAAFGEVLVLAVHWPAVQEVLAGAGDLSGKVLIDCTNRMGPPAPGAAPSGAQDVARWAPGARVVKAFNTLGAENLTNLRFGSLNASAFICGDDEGAKAVVARLAEDVGFDVVDCGPLSSAALVESLARLWVTIAQRSGRHVAFRLLRR